MAGHTVRELITENFFFLFVIYSQQILTFIGQYLQQILTYIKQYLHIQYTVLSTAQYKQGNHLKIIQEIWFKVKGF